MPKTKQPAPARPPTRLLTKAEVLARVGVTFPTIWKWMREGTFPRARRLTAESKSTRAYWYESEIEAWLANLPVKRLKGDK
jgi:predicted DNA-binding transcriptional regulator AlpA